MPKGPTPKPPEQRINRVKPAVPETRLPRARPGKRPTLPAADWHPNVARWWAAWLRTPAAVLFADTEWERLLRALPVAQQYWLAVDSGVPAAIYAGHRALLEAEKGLPATDHERRRAGIHVALAPDDHADLPVVSASAQRERIRLA